MEQYLNATCSAPFATSHRQAASDCATASATGTERVFSEITAASIPGAGAPSGIPAYCSVRAPARASVFAASLEPVKSSPITPIFMSSLPPRDRNYPAWCTTSRVYSFTAPVIEET